MQEKGSFFLHLDWNANFLGRILLDNTFENGFVNEIIWRIGWVSGYKTQVDAFVRNHDTIFYYSPRGKDAFFNKNLAKILYLSFDKNTINREIRSIISKWNINPQNIRNIKLSFIMNSGEVYKLGLTTKTGYYNIEDTWNCNEYEELNSNKIKRNAKEYTPNGSFLTQKPEELLERIICLTTKEKDLVMDCFLGSGTTVAVAHKLNRKYIGVEIGNYFDTDILWRMKHLLFGKGPHEPCGISKKINWNGGGFFKYIRLESYEDTLNNLKTLEETNPERKEALEIAFKESPKFREDFMLHYLLDFETRESPSLLPIEVFNDPWAYTLDIATEVVGETRTVKVDLVETFNYLLGLRVKHISEKERFTVPGFDRDEYRKLRVKDNRLIPVSPEKSQSAAQEGVWTFQTVEGELPDGRRALVIWRTLSDDPEKDCAVLETFMEKKGYAARDTEFDVIYINGQHTLPGPFKVHRTEFEFKDRMFTEIEV